MDSSQTDKKISKAVLLVSQSQTYQKRIFTFLCFTWSQITMNALINPVIFTNPLFMKNGQKKTEAYCCTPGNQSQCDFVNNYTGTYYAGFYCDQRDVRMMLQAVLAIGSISGFFVIPLISDLKGKKVAMTLCLLCMLIGNLGIFFGIYQKMPLLIALSQFINSFGANSAAAVSYSINSDFYNDDRRQKAVLFYCAACGFTSMIMVIVYYVMPYWRMVMILLILLPVTILTLSFNSIFLQSAHYLINAKQDYQGANQVIEKLAQINNAGGENLQKSKAILKQVQLTLSTTTQKKQKQTAKQTLTVIFQTPRYLRAAICLGLLKMSIFAFYFVAQNTSQRIGFNWGISLCLIGSGQFTAYMIGSRFIPKFHRKKVLIVTFTILIFIGFLYTTKTVKQSPLISSILLYLSITQTSANWSSLTLLQTQSFPATVRSTAVGICFGAATLIRMVIPFGIGFLNQRGINPIVAATVFVLIIGMPSALMINQTFGFSNQEQPLLAKEHQLQLKTTAPCIGLPSGDKKQSIDHF